MIYYYSILIIFISSFLWRVRGGLRFFGKKAPLNKIWWAVFFALYSNLYFGFDLSLFIVSLIASYSAYQLFGWGLYIGHLLLYGKLNPEKDRECELIDDLLYSVKLTLKGNTYHLYDFPRLFGFLGTSLAGLIVTFLPSLIIYNIPFMLCGFFMGLCFIIGIFLEKLYPLGKSGWNWGEWIFGAVMGGFLASAWLW